MNEALKAALGLMQEISDRFNEQTERLTTASMQAGLQLNDNREALGAQSEELTRVAADATKAMKVVGELFTQQTGSLAVSSDPHLRVCPRLPNRFVSRRASSTTRRNRPIGRFENWAVS